MSCPLLWLTSCAFQSDKTAAQIVEEHGNAVVLVMNLGPLNTPQVTASGFFIRSNGIVVTNRHVLVRAKSIRAKLSDGRELEVEGLIGFDQQSPLAILKVKGAGYPTVKLGDSETVKAGDRVVAVGSPAGGGNAFNEGFVTRIQQNKPQTSEGSGLEKLFLIGTPISVGNSGGPLFNMRGVVIGISSAVPGSEGLNMDFGVPVNVLKPLIRDGPVQPLDSSPVTQTPLGCRVVGNMRSQIYHVPGGQYFEQMVFTSPDGACFTSEEEATHFGFRPSTR